MSNITVIDSIMGSGKTTWAKAKLRSEKEKNFLYITPYNEEIEEQILGKDEDGHLKNGIEKVGRHMVTPMYHGKGKGKLDNIVTLFEGEFDIAATHALFKMFDERCKQALKEHHYTLILDETIDAVGEYHFEKRDDYLYLLQHKDIAVDEDGAIKWTGDNDLHTRFDDVRILANNKSLFRIDKSFFLWNYPPEIFGLFDEVYILTYMFDGSLMKYYFDLYNIEYQTKSLLRAEDGATVLTEPYNIDKSRYRERINVYEGKMNTNISQKPNVLSATWCRAAYNHDELAKIKRNFTNFTKNICKAKSSDVLWTTIDDAKKQLSGKGYAHGFIPCNKRATNKFQNATCLMYGMNWYTHPEIIKFFTARGITVDNDKIALSTFVQWAWRSNIRDTESDKEINIYIPSVRMRRLFTEWLAA